MEFEPVIGFEVHAQLATASKIFCGCANEPGGAPNTRVCPVCLGMPGALPVLSGEVLDHGVRVALALHARVAPRMGFARKNYFYPDLPKGYQITQYDEPLAQGGFLDVDVHGVAKRIAIRRIHLEEDAGKTTHVARGERSVSLIDMNRCGVPLIEIVTCPDIRSVDEAAAFLVKLRRLLVFLGASSGRMHEGSMRFDTNVSVRRRGETALGTQTEIKNLNSFRAAERALAYEIERQCDVLRRGGRVEHETLLWDERAGKAVSMRSKEVAPDYRYFPEPDLPDVVVDPERVVELARTMPELPDEAQERLAVWYGLSREDAGVLTAEPGPSVVFELIARELLGRGVPGGGDGAVDGAATPALTVARPIDMRNLPRPADTDEDRQVARTVASWVTVILGGFLNERGIRLDEFALARGGGSLTLGRLRLASRLAAILRPKLAGGISESAAKRLFESAIESDEPVDALVATLDLAQVSDEDVLSRAVGAVLDEHPREVERYRAGELKLVAFFMGEVMKKTRGKADPRRANEILHRSLGGSGGPRA
jgi:aspartyl-tRNA(Asn)/glutamyl-tRNA(Gln) amidotransferase subunit B